MTRLIILATAAQGLLGVGLILASFVMAVAWGWRSVTENRADGRWSPARRMLWVGAAISILANLEVALLEILPR